MIRLKRVEIEGFRGFADEAALDLDADAVVIRGDNGTGKTSLVDALLWLVCGRLAHLEERVKTLRRSEDVVTNRFRPGGARVTLHVGVSGIDFVYTRLGDQRENELLVAGQGGAVVDADPEKHLAEAFGIRSGEELRRSVLTWGLLRQDAIRVALDETGGALHERLSGLIGLEQVSRFASAASDASTGLVRERTAARRARDNAESRAEEATRRVEVAEQAAGPPEAVAELFAAGLTRARARAEPFRLEWPDTVAPESLGGVREAVAAIGGALRDLAARQQELAQHPAHAEEVARAADAAMSSARRLVAETTERGPALVRLASAAMGLLGERCPVCEQPIDESSVRSHLKDVLSQAQTQVAEGEDAQRALTDAQAKLARAQDTLTQRRLAAERVQAAEARVRSALEAGSALVSLELPSLEPAAVDQAMRALGEAAEELAGLARAIAEASGPNIARLAEEADAANTDLALADGTVDGLELRCQRAKKLEHAAHDAAQAILEDALEALRPTFAEVFDRLHPNPAFTELRAKQDVLRNRNQIIPVVRDRERDIEANPLLVFSEGQLNVVALSYFLGMALNAREAALPFIVLDDPLQALDVIAILGFGDLCRQIREQRQLIVTTHDRRFADVLVRKLSPRESGETLLVHDFEGWTRKGPLVSSRRPDVVPVMRLLAQRAS